MGREVGGADGAEPDVSLFVRGLRSHEQEALMHAGWTAGAFALALVITTTGGVGAQALDRHGVPYRQWDVTVGGGIHGLSGEDMRPQVEEGWNSDGGPSWVWSTTLGRNWNGHFKTELGYAGFSERGWSNRMETVTGVGGRPTQLWRSAETRVNQVVLGASWQYGENAYVHPFISGGVRVGLLDTREHAGWVEGLGQVPGSARWREVRPRAYLSAGSKSYFNERTFMRPEAVVAFSPSGVAQVGVHLTFGVDF